MKQRRISVAYFSNSEVRGGAEEHILTLLRRLDRSRFAAHLVCTPAVASMVRGDVPADVGVTPLTLRHPRHLSAAMDLGRLLRARRVEVLHSHLFYASVFASPIGRLCRVPFIVETPHISERWRQGLKGHYAIDRGLGRCVDRFIAVSEANGRYLIEEKGLPREKVVVIHNGCDLERFDPRHEAPAGLRESLGFGQRDPIIVAAGRLEPQKGHTVLLDAIRIVRRSFPTVRLVCVGEGGLRGTLERRATELGLADAVRFVGQQTNITDWFALADVTVLSSLYEGLPLVAIESLACERAMVATAVDGTPEVVVHEETGLTVPPGNAVALATALTRLLGDPTLRNRLARQGRERVLAGFSDRLQVSRTETLYERGLGRETVPSTAESRLVAVGGRR
jgi:glycosyltransferase involved in cell wall biosynthesis